MKATIAVIILLLALSASANAVTLHATGGSFGVSEASFWEPGVALIGDSWALHGFSGQSCCIFTVEQPSYTFTFVADHLTLGGITYTPPTCCDTNSAITVSHGPWAPFPPLIPAGFQPFVAGNFTFTGHIGLAGGVDIEGAGWAYIDRFTSIGFAGDQIIEFSNLRLTYFVPESPSAALLVIALLGVAVAHRWRHRFGSVFASRASAEQRQRVTDQHHVCAFFGTDRSRAHAMTSLLLAVTPY
jgi:hypothetical protein